MGNNRVIMDNYLFSIIIPSWNNLPFLDLCIRSIRKNSDYNHQIIVYVNEGTDGTLDYVKENNIDYAYSPVNAGVCTAMNEARKLMKTDYLVFFNDDFYACPHWDSVMWDYIKELDTDKFFISGIQIQRDTHFYNNTIKGEYGHGIEDFDEEKLLAEYESYPLIDDNFACAPPNICHVDIWDKVGGYSIEFSPGYASDPDFTAKCFFNAGVTHFKQLGASRIYHFMNKSTLRNKNMNEGRVKVWNEKWEFSQGSLRSIIKAINDVRDPKEAKTQIIYKQN